MLRQYHVIFLLYFFAIYRRYDKLWEAEKYWQKLEKCHIIGIEIYLILTNLLDVFLSFSQHSLRKFIFWGYSIFWDAHVASKIRGQLFFSISFVFSVFPPLELPPPELLLLWLLLLFSLEFFSLYFTVNMIISLTSSLKISSERHFLNSTRSDGTKGYLS